jgi:Tat protein translocase TatB subunit
LFLFILESFGTPELLLVGLVALILLGPRKLPELARKAGKMMSEFRGTANEFKETWQREVNFEEEAKALDINALETESVSRVNSTPASKETPIEPSIREVDPAKFEDLVQADLFPAQPNGSAQSPVAEPTTTSDINNDKKNWL